MATAEKYGILALRYYFGAHTFISGINHYLLFFPDLLPLKPEMTGRFMQSLVDSRLYDVCKVTEIIVGFALLAGIYIPLALLVEIPVTVVIFYVSVVMTGTPRTIFTGWREILLNVFLLSGYWGYFKLLVLSPRLPLKPLWSKATP